LFIFKHDFSKISVDLQTSLAIETQVAEGQWLEEQLTVTKLHMFRVVTELLQGERDNILHQSDDA
jgi:hypothetical protein